MSRNKKLGGECVCIRNKPQCNAEAEAWLCCREVGHTGEHVACTDVEHRCFVWPNELEQNDLLAMQEIRAILGDPEGKLTLNDIVAKVKALVERDAEPDFSRMSLAEIDEYDRKIHAEANAAMIESYRARNQAIRERWPVGTILHRRGGKYPVTGHDLGYVEYQTPAGKRTSPISAFDEYHQTPGAEGGEDE